MRIKNKAESQRVASHPDVDAQPRQCFGNSFRAVMYLPEFSSATYIEGIAVLDCGMAIEHGWVERGGEVIDPTLPEDDLVYFPGLRFEGVTGVSEAMRIPKKPGCDDLPLFYRFGWGGRESEEFQSAWKHALECSSQLMDVGKG